MGAYPVYGCLKYIPHRISGAALVVPVVNFWCPCFPAKLSKQAFKTQPFQLRWTFQVAHYAPWLLNWWMTQNLFPYLNFMNGIPRSFSTPDLHILQQFPSLIADQVKVHLQGVHECFHRDMMIGQGKWEFDPTDISNPFPDNEGSVHIWQGLNDKIVPPTLTRYLTQQLPWIRYHEVPDAGHLLIYNSTLCEDIFKALFLS